MPWGQQTQVVNKTLSHFTFQLVMVNVLANSNLFTHPTVMEQHCIHLELCFCAHGEYKSSIHAQEMNSF